MVMNRNLSAIIDGFRDNCLSTNSISSLNNISAGFAGEVKFLNKLYVFLPRSVNNAGTCFSPLISFNAKYCSKRSTYKIHISKSRRMTLSYQYISSFVYTLSKYYYKSIRVAKCSVSLFIYLVSTPCFSTHHCVMSHH